MGTDPPTTPAAPPPRGGLLTVLGPVFGVSIIVGGTIGVGILKQPGVVAQQLPHPGLFLLAWAVGGLYCLLGAVSVAELAAMTPRSGAYYVYVRRAFGEYPGFVTGWAHWLALCSGAGFIYLTLTDYLVALVPDLSPARTVLPVALVGGFAALQWRSVRDAGTVQSVSTVLKGLGFVALVVGFFALATPPAGDSQPAPPLPADWALLAAAVLAFQAILQTYDGWEGAIYFGGEVRDPGRTLPRSLFLGTLTVVAVYLGVNLALLYVLPIGRIAGSEMAVGLAAEEVFGSAAGFIVAILATASILVTCNAGTMQTPRVLHAMSTDGLFFRPATWVNRGGTPTIALTLSTAAIVAFLVTGTAGELLAILAFFLVMNYTLMYLSVFILRRREPDAPRPYRAWGYPFTTGVALLGSLVYLGVAVATDPWHSLYALGLLAASYPIFLVVRRLRGVTPAAGGSPG